VKVNLSYIIATRNRLPFLKITLTKLLAALRPDEEIIVVDGNSTDGTKEYLQQLLEAGSIHQFVSEPDKNQAHAWNKAMLMARGILIKKVIDDDVLCYTAIQKCREHMLQNASIDVLISNDLSSSLHHHLKIEKHTRLPHFEKWLKNLAPSFTFGDVHMLIRRSSLSYVGLYNPAYTMMDWEYALRISYLQANITYYTGYNALTVAHGETVTSLKDEKKIAKQGKRAEVFYEYAGDHASISYWSKLKIAVGKMLYKSRAGESPLLLKEEEIAVIYNHYDKYLTEINETGSFIFLDKNSI